MKEKRPGVFAPGLFLRIYKDENVLLHDHRLVIDDVGAFLQLLQRSEVAAHQLAIDRISVERFSVLHGERADGRSDTLRECGSRLALGIERCDGIGVCAIGHLAIRKGRLCRFQSSYQCLVTIDVVAFQNSATTYIAYIVDHDTKECLESVQWRMAKCVAPAGRLAVICCHSPPETV